MKKIAGVLAALILLLSACAAPAPAEEDGVLHVLATTYPVYLFTTAVTEGVEGVQVELLVNQPTACLHDYTMTVNNMKAIERADIIVMNGVGMEDFMADALSESEADVFDCSEDIALMPALGHEGHDHAAEFDPHIWMSPVNAEAMVDRVATGLSGLDESNADRYAANAAAAAAALKDYFKPYAQAMEGHPEWKLITFHDGFQYFAGAFGLNLLKAIEEEEGAEASAAEIKEVVGLVREHNIPAIFTERNGSDATAKAISRETGVAVCQLDMIMSGEGSGIQAYIDAMDANYHTIMEALG